MSKGIIETLPVKGFPYNEVRFQLYNADGNIILDRKEKNLVVDAGLSVIADRMQNTPTLTEMTHMAVGTDNTAEADTQTALIAQHADGRVALDSTTIVTTNVADDTLQYVATFAAGASTGALVEAGIFNNVTTGQMLRRTVFSVINKGASDSLVITWKVVIT